MLEKLDNKFGKINKSIFAFLKTIVMAVGIFYIFYMAFTNQGFYGSFVSCTKSMYPYIDCPCLTVMKSFDSYGGDTGFMVPTSDANKTIEENMKVIQSDDYVNEYIQNNTKIGDVISFRSQYGRGYIMHRVIDKCYWQDMMEENGTIRVVNVTQKGVLTRGDNNPVDDGCVPFKDIVGKLVWKTC